MHNVLGEFQLLNRFCWSTGWSVSNHNAVSTELLSLAIIMYNSSCLDKTGLRSKTIRTDSYITLATRQSTLSNDRMIRTAAHLPVSLLGPGNSNDLWLRQYGDSYFLPNTSCLFLAVLENSFLPMGWLGQLIWDTASDMSAVPNCHVQIFTSYNKTLMTNTFGPWKFVHAVHGFKRAKQMSFSQPK